MRTILFLLQKEFLQIFRNRAMLPLITVIPIVQLVVLSFAASHEVKNIKLAVQDQDHSEYSRRLRDKLAASDYFELRLLPRHSEQSLEAIASNTVDLVLVIPPGFGRALQEGQGTKLQLLVNAINGSKAGVANAYVQAVIRDFQLGALSEQVRLVSGPSAPAQIKVEYANWYNPRLDYKTFMVPGILGELVTILTMVLAAMNIVREKEVGTIEQLNVTPIKKYQLLIGKLLPFLIIGLADLAIGLIVGKLLFQIPMEGDLFLVFSFCIVDIIVVLGIGLLISTQADTQQQSMLISWFFIIIFVLMSGLFTPIDSMPEWAQYLTIPNPAAHFVAVMRQVLLKGANFWEIQYHFYTMLGLGVFLNALAIWLYRKRN